VFLFIILKYFLFSHVPVTLYVDTASHSTEYFEEHVFTDSGELECLLIYLHGPSNMTQYLYDTMYNKRGGC
jgi:hypothetical protein